MTRRAFVVVTVIVLSAFAVQPSTRAAAGRAMTIDDLIGAVRVSDPQVLANGQLVVFVRTTTDLKSGARNSDIWAVEASGTGQARVLIGGDKSENSPRPLPDNQHLAFISTRDGAPQVYRGGPGGTIKKLTSVPMGVQPPLVVSPDGSRVAFVSDVYPECSDDACNRKKAEEAEKNPVKVHRATHLLYRHWDEWRDGVRHHVFVTDVENGQTVDVTPGDFDSPPTQQEDGGIAFSPDGKEIAFVSNREGADREAWTTNLDVWTVPVTGGQARKLTANQAADAQPLFSPDGKTVFTRSQRRPGFESDRWYIDAYDRAAGTKRTLFETPDLSVSDMALSKDGATIWFVASQDGRDNLFSVFASGGTPKRVVQGGAISAARPADNFLVYSKSTLTAPADLYRVSADGAKEVPLTRENASWLGETTLSKPESLTVPGADKTPVQYWLIRPPDFDAAKKYPVVFLIHGGPQGAWGDAWSYRWNPSLWAAQGWVVVAPNPRGSTGFGQTFVDQISRDWGGKVMIDLNAVFDVVAKQPFVDNTRMGIAGASYGGYAVDWILGHTTRFKAAVTHDGVFNLESSGLSTEELWFPEWEFAGRPWDATARAQFAKFSPHLFAHNIKTPTLIITNERDYRVTVDQGIQMFTVLRRNGVPAEMLSFPDEGHWVLKALNSRYWHEAVFGWMRKYL
jgi:dipeptidyl aminopeptidase/acylaminoacyl peptidase